MSKLLEAISNLPLNNLRLLNIGGGWGEVSSDFWRSVRALVPPWLRLMIEPGRQWTEDAGWAFSSIDALTFKQERVCFLEGVLSPGAHLRWAFPREVSFIPGHQKAARVEGDFYWSSKSCWEWDRLHLFTGTQDVAIGDRIVLGGIAGYAYAWNHAFNGISAISTRVI